jgi:predicted O-methyltransferase YrrM
MIHLRSDRAFRENRVILDEAERYALDGAPAETIEGLIHPREGLLLYVLARRAAHLGDIVEIGSYKGKSTWYLAQGLADAGSPHKVVSIDPHEDPAQREAYFANLERHGLLARVEPVVDYSHDVAQRFDRKVGMLWIDGDHSYAGVREDFDDWFPRLEVGGWYAMHDTVNAWYGPTRLARELLGHRDDLARIGVVWLVLFAQKVAPSVRARAGGIRARAAFEALTLAQARRNGLGPQAAAAGERGGR